MHRFLSGRVEPVDGAAQHTSLDAVTLDLAPHAGERYRVAITGSSDRALELAGRREATVRCVGWFAAT